MKELNPGLKALKAKDPKLVAKMLNKPVDEVKKMMKGGKVKMAYGGKVKMMGGGYMDDEKKKMAYGGKVKMKKGGSTSKKSKKCPINGMAKRGKTRGVTVVA
jgi:hypothetical protein